MISIGIVLNAFCPVPPTISCSVSVDYTLLLTKGVVRILFEGGYYSISLWSSMRAGTMQRASSESTSTISSGVATNKGSGSQICRDVSAWIREALSRWKRKKLQADNIAILFVVLL